MRSNGNDLSVGHPHPRFIPPDGFPGLDAVAWGEDDCGLWQTLEVVGVEFRLRWMPPGEFQMGSPKDEPERSSDETRHRVELTQGFWLAETTVTQALWEAVTGENPSWFKGPERPVERVSWDDCQTFLERIESIQPGLGLRLPTEAEWEYACRAGTDTPFGLGVNITSEQVNYNGNLPYRGGREGDYREETVEVTALPCNDWGLYQMHGNCWEWCADWYGEYAPEPESGPVQDPAGPATGAGRVLRGGSWGSDASWARSAYRLWRQPGIAFDNTGLRLARGQDQHGQGR